MSTAHDIQRPDDQFGLMGDNWPVESESAYATAERQATTASNTAQAQAQEATDAATKTDSDMKGKTAESVSNGYSHSASQLHEQSVHYNTVSAWMADAGGAVAGAKRRISTLVRSGTQEIRDAITAETQGTPVTPSSTELTDKYRADISSVSVKLATELDSIGHSLSGDSGASTTPAYVRTEPTAAAPTIQQAAHQEASGQTPAVEPHQLPPMPRASTPTPESPSTPGAPSSTVSPHATNPTLAGLIAGSASPSGTPASPSAKSPSTPSGTPAGQGAQARQPNETHQNAKSPVLPRIPSIPLTDLPTAAQAIATTVSSATAHQLPTSTPPSTPGSAQAPASTRFTPGTSGTPPMTPTPPAGLSPVGGLPTAPVVQTPPAPQGTPATPTPGVQTPSAPQSPTPRGPVADISWIQKSYGLSPSLELPKSESPVVPALFIAGLPEHEAHLHRALATLRHAFDDAGWSQPMTVARIKRGLDTKLVYATADGLSIHPHGVLLPHGVLPLDEMTSAPATSELSGSLMVTEKLVAMIPRGWTVEQVLSTVSGGEGSQSIEQFQSLVEAGELLPCTVSRGRNDVEVDEALRVFARAAIGSRGCSELDVESARLRAARWVGVQSQGYLDTLSRWYLADAAESMSQGNWGEAVWASEKYMSFNQSRSQAA